ncbi:hypothetical protein P152DRAFT_474960 [Eremomyces bilateralis CBS 781.70]|uniref:Uncharacterized protein n=1 Tax=Eremomyces bilateralis CBS 781.70 TaxID=1392243 RepID=A0A6G1FZT2_9PEZI|nr:uncharacterized protein P152DRAFT_474960 [Eremomyces bilateralis CBS 781.70]KAF1811367.1 hypothetical protein P152DRAFT_474960 [Eremomyces bilateralis CBS 781.70]
MASGYRKYITPIRDDEEELEDQQAIVRNRLGQANPQEPTQHQQTPSPPPESHTSPTSQGGNDGRATHASQENGRRTGPPEDV